MPAESLRGSRIQFEIKGFLGLSHVIFVFAQFLRFRVCSVHCNKVGIAE